jgi:diamine N-acetyltransferase
MTTVTLAPITPENWKMIVRLKPAEDQASFIEPNDRSLAESIFLASYQARAICAGETVVGFLMYYRRVEEDGTCAVWLDRFMIGAEHQRKGYGRAALDHWLAEIRARPDCTAIGLTLVPGNRAAQALYERAGFRVTDDIDENGEQFMTLAVEHPADEQARLAAIDRDNWQAAAALQVREDQRGFVTRNLLSMIESHFTPAQFPYAIYASGKMVGFTLYGYETIDSYDLWYIARLMIDSRFQGKGYGRTALAAIVADIRQRAPKAEGVVISYVPENRYAGELYKRFGFLDEGTTIEGEILLRLPFQV